MTSIQNLIVRRALLSKTIAEYEQLIQTAPEGDLIARKQPAGNYSYTRKIHLPDGRIKEIYLGRAASDEVTALAQKRCALKALPSLKQEYKLLDKLIALRMKDSECDLFLKDHPAICSLLHLSTEEELLAWKNAPYNRNVFGCRYYPMEKSDRNHRNKRFPIGYPVG